MYFYFLRHLILEKSTERMKHEGLNSVKYKVLERKISKYYTKFLVYYNETELMQDVSKQEASTINSTEIEANIL